MMSPVDEIKNRLDIVEVIGSYIKLQKAGVNLRAVCPFHSEKKPSFFVSPTRQIWHCFGGCSDGGDIFKFVMKIEGVEFGDALRILAQKAGVELKPISKESASWRTERQQLYEICELATKFFEKQLNESKGGEAAKKYLLSRGITKESLQTWRIGYAPDTWQGLSDFLSSRSYQSKEVEKAGLGLTSQIGSFYDRFRGRIIFPIFDLNSQVVGFGGRVFKDRDNKEIAKYVNTPNTLLYDKSRILYGLDKAKLDIRKKDSCILVEGYIDAIMASQAGSENVAATSGTALTSYQLKILKRYSNNLYTAFDMDLAGDTATKRGIELAQAEGFSIKVITLPQDSDPADIVSKSPKDWQKFLEEAKSILEFYFESAFSKADPGDPEGKKIISKILLPQIRRIPNQIEKSFWIQELAKKLSVREDDIIEELKKTKLDETPDFKPEEPENLPQKSRRELLEERLMALILKSPENLDLVNEDKIILFTAKIQEILTCLKKNSKDFSEDTGNYFNYLALKSEVEEIDEKDILPEIQLCLKEIQSHEIKSRLGVISKDIKKAEGERDWSKIEELIKEFNSHSKSRSDLEAI